MAAPTTREDVLRMMNEKEAIEIEISQLTEELTQPGMPGLKEPLVDREGFPRADIDLFHVRTLRNRLACLQTDHMQLMKKIEDGLYLIHSAVIPEKEPEGTSSKPAAHQPRMQPFALIDEVSAGSPAEDAGLKVGDRVVEFGTVNISNHNNLQAVAEVVKSHVDQDIQLVVQRTADLVKITLRPHTWSGRGLLGCHLKPL
eukprot:GILK01002608.1.p1 GENE.GILK01002608.1~~GILK01002608.1.p1  ORF type:complete len:227 (+),score=24.04 GILK01002608.1:83-682(+)